MAPVGLSKGDANLNHLVKLLAGKAAFVVRQSTLEGTFHQCVSLSIAPATQKHLGVVNKALEARKLGWGTKLYSHFSPKP